MANPNRISVSPSSISLTYNFFDNTQSGANVVRVTATYNDGSPTGEVDSFTVDSDDDFFVDSDTFTNFVINVDNTMIPNVTGNYTYLFTVTGDNSGLSKPVTVNLSIINEDLTPPEDYIYKTKYFIERTGYKLEIQKLVIPSAIVIPVEINGTIEYKYQTKKDLFDPISASSLKLQLESSLYLTLDDLYSEDEKTYRTVMYKNSQIVFIGFIKPDGIFEDYVVDRWFLEIDSYDGLSTLKDITFLNENGISFSGRKSGFDIVHTCLLKTGLDLPININCGVFYEGYTLTPSFSILEGIYLNTERFYQNSSTAMNCEDVLKSILQIFNASLIQFNGEWYIYRTIDLTDNMTFSKYTLGEYVEDFIIDTSVNLGSHINGFDIFHCNSNQKKSISASVQAYKIIYKYGSINSVFSNGQLKLEGSGLDIPGWTVNNPDGDVFRNSDGFGLDSITHYFSNNAPALLTMNQTLVITEGSVMNLKIAFTNESVLRFPPPSDSSKGLTFSLGVGGNWLKDDGTWDGTQNRIYISNSGEISEPTFNAFIGKGFATYEAKIRSPFNGQLELIIWRDKHEVGNGHFKIHSIDLSGSNDSDIKGREYTAQRTQKLSTVTKQNITVYNGDSVSDLIIGTIFKSDADTATTKWYRDTLSEFKELLEINAEDNLRVSPRPMALFEGDVYGYIPFLSVIYNDFFIGKKFQPLEWSYNFNTDTLRLNSKEFSSILLEPTDFTVNVTNNYGDETKVTIVG